ncbi:MAG: CHASE domain-containing protein [Deltaproteobacteria bacterium]|nr:CHASE domain-containing protein [Deltaproteobacteria bacterium]
MPVRGRRHVFWLPGLLAVAGLVLSYRTAALRHQSQQRLLRQQMQAALEPMRGELSRQISAAVHLSEGIASLISIEGEPPPARFHALATELLKRGETIRNIALAPDNVVSQVHPLEGNQAAIGLRYADSEAQWPSVQRMMAEDRLIVAGPVQLVQGGVGVIARRPIHVADPGSPGGTRYWGLTSTVIEFQALLAHARITAVAGPLRLALRGVDGTGAQGPIFWGEPRVFASAPVLSDIPLPSGSWQLGGVPTGGWPAFHVLESGYFQAGALASLVLAALLVGLLRVMNALERARLELEERVAARTRELVLARDAAESADRLKSAFLATMSHELRTPLNSIIGFTGILRMGMSGPINPEQTKQLHMVESSSHHLLALINDVLDLSKIEAGHVTLEAEPFDAHDSLTRALESVRGLADKKGLALFGELDPALGGAHGDRRRFEQVVLNLLSNAIKFTEAGTVTLAATRRGDALEVAVSDTGIGIAADQLPGLFRPFHQVDSGLARSHDGTGLGLSICRKLVDLMGGTIKVDSELGVGSTFTVAVPVAAAATASSPATLAGS